jgi:2-oxoglutarate ferredoxin oxidoreductase subunit beta
VIFNNKTFDPVYGRDVRSEQVLFLEDQQPMIYGAESDKGIAMNGTKPQIVSSAEGAPIVHDSKNEDPGYTYALASMTHPEFPTPMGVFRAVERPTFEGDVHAQIQHAQASKGKGDLGKLILGGDYWEVSDDGEREVKSSDKTATQASSDEQTIAKERSAEAQRYTNDPAAKVFNTRLEEIIAVFGQPKAAKADASTSIAEVLKTMKLELVSSVLITKNNEICGIFTERDVLFKVINIVEDLDSTSIESVMTSTPETAQSWQTVAQALHALGDGGYRHLPVIREKGKIGVITTKGIMHYLHKQILNHH